MSYEYNIDEGIISADTSDIKTGVENEYKSALNAPNLSLKASSPQGTLIASETLSRQGIMKNNAEMANVINPNYSYGVFLDAICAFLGIERGEDKATSVTGVQFTGSSVDAAVTIPAGSRVKTTAGDVFLTSTTITIPKGLGSTVTGSIVSQENGDIPAAVGPLTITDGTIGFASAAILDDSVVTLGSAQLTDPQLKSSRNRRLYTQGIGSIGSIRSHILSLDNIKSVNAIENITGQIASPVNGITFTLGNAVWVCVYGSEPDANIAAALWKAHGGGAFDYGASGQGTQVGAPNGVATTDKYSGVDYNVKFVRAVEKTAYVKATVKRGTSTATQSSIINSMVSYANGEIDGEDGLIIGYDVSAYEFAGAINNKNPGLFVSKVEVAITAVGAPVPAPGDYSDIAVIQPWEIAIASTGTISVVVS